MKNNATSIAYSLLMLVRVGKGQPCYIGLARYHIHQRAKDAAVVCTGVEIASHWPGIC